MFKQILQKYILDDRLVMGPPGPQGPKGDTGRQGPPGYIDTAENAAIWDELKFIRDELDQLRLKLDSITLPRPSTRFADILFPNGIVAPDGTPLTGNTLDGKYDYSLEFVTDGTLKIINDVQSLDSNPAYINLEVKGEGNLAIMIIQTLIHKGSTYVFKKPLCSFTIITEQRDYHVFNVDAYSITYMNNYAAAMGQNTINPES